MPAFVTWDVSPSADLMISITQANLRAAFANLSQNEAPKEEPKED